MYYDVVEMELLKVILGYPWLYDRKVVHFVRPNTYSAVVNGR